MEKQVHARQASFMFDIEQTAPSFNVSLKSFFQYKAGVRLCRLHTALKIKKDSHMKTINEYKRMTLADQVLIPAFLAVVLGLSGCQQEEGSAEKAGQKIDRAYEKGEQKIEQSRIDATQKLEAAKESLDQQADRTTQYIEESTEASKEALEKAGDEIEQTTEAAGQELERAKEAAIDRAQTAGEYIDDSVISLKVKAALVNDPMLQASQIEVTTVNGIVKLSGTVGSQQDVDRALEIAVNQQNVKSVQSDLIVKTAPSAE